MKKEITTYLLVAVFSLAGGVVHADPLTIPNTFVSGTTAKAAEVNANFQAVKNAVDNNDARISSLEGHYYPSLAWSSDNTVTITPTDCNVLSITVNSPTQGYIVVTGTGYFGVDHVSGTADAPRVSLSNVSGVMSYGPMFTLFEIPKELPTGTYHCPFSITGVFGLQVGTSKLYMVADVYNGPGYSSSAYIGRRYLTGIIIRSSK